MVSAGWGGGPNVPLASAKVVDGNGRLIRALNEERGFTFDQVGFSSDGRLVATAASAFETEELHVEIWNWQNGTVVHEINGASRLALDPSSPRMLTVVRGHAEIRDLETERVLAVLAGQSGDIYTSAFSPDGSFVATGRSDGTIRVFETSTGAQRLVLPGSPCGGVDDVAFSPDGTKLASTSGCDGVRIWALDIDDLLRIARHKLTRPLTDGECLQYLHADHCP